MKWIKTYESKLSKSKQDQISRYIEDTELDWELADERYAITYDEFLKDFPLESFKNDYGLGLYDEITFAYPNIGSYGLSSDYFSKVVELLGWTSGIGVSFQSYGDVTIPSYFKNNFEWFKRNIIVEVALNTGGASGGNCWGDDAEYYDSGKQLDMDIYLNWLKPKIKSIIAPHANMKSESELIEEIRKSNIIRSRDYTNYEYYGNYDDYQTYYFTLFDMFKLLGDNSTF